MTNPRFTIAAGVLGMSLCGLAAIANSSGKAGSPLGCYRAGETIKPISPATQSTEQYQVALKVVSDPPVDIPPVTPPLIQLPSTDKPVVPTPPMSIPTIPDLAVVPPLTPTVEPAQLAIPKLPESPRDTLPPPQVVVPESKPAPQAVAKPDAPILDLIPAPSNVIPQATPPAPAAPAALNADGIKIIVQMIAGRPSLTILSDNAEMMTLTCEQLDLAARGPGDESVTGIKATGKVTFTAPGCQGSCDELTLNPKSWDGSMLKNVKAKCTSGTGTTELAADKMNFKLRSPKETVVPTIPASHNSTRR
jgi:hypothetical protein